MPLNLPFIAGQTKDPKQYEIWRSMAQQALKGGDIVASYPVTKTVPTSSETPITLGLASPLVWPIIDKGGQYFDVKAYGAKGNGTTDDTAAINLTITTAIAAGGGVIYFPPGFYKITSAISIPTSHRGLTLMGAGGAYASPGSSALSTIIWAGATSSTMLPLLNTQDFWVLGLCWDGGGVTGTTAISLDSNGSQPCKATRIRDCMFRRVETGIQVGNSANQTDTIWVSDNRFYEGISSTTSSAIVFNCANVTGRFSNLEMIGWRYGFKIVNVGNITIDDINGGNVAATAYDLIYVDGSYTSIDVNNSEAEGPGTISHLTLTGSASGGLNAPITMRGCSLNNCNVAIAARIITEGCHYQNSTFTYSAGASKHLSINDAFVGTGNIAVGATGTFVTYINGETVSVGAVPSTRQSDWYLKGGNTRVRATSDAATNPGYEIVQTGQNSWTMFNPASSNNLNFFEGGGAGNHFSIQGGANSALLWYCATQPMAIPAVLFTQTADATTTANTLTTLFGTGTGTLTLPANFFIAGRTIEIEMGGYISTADGGAGTKTLTLSLGGVTVATATSGATFTTVVNNGWSAKAFITCRTTGAGGTCIGGAQWETQIATANPNAVYAVATGTAALDTTATRTLDLKINNGNATGAIRTTYARVKVSY